MRSTLYVFTVLSTICVKKKDSKVQCASPGRIFVIFFKVVVFLIRILSKHILLTAPWIKRLDLSTLVVLEHGIAYDISSGNLCMHSPVFLGVVELIDCIHHKASF